MSVGLLGEEEVGYESPWKWDKCVGHIHGQDACTNNKMTRKE